MPTFPRWLHLGSERFADLEAGRPGFTDHLRTIARENLRSLDGETVHLAVRVLAILGTRDDVNALQSVRDAYRGPVATDAGSSIFEIEHRTRAILRTLQLALGRGAPRTVDSSPSAFGLLQWIKVRHL